MQTTKRTIPLAPIIDYFAQEMMQNSCKKSAQFSLMLKSDIFYIPCYAWNVCVYDDACLGRFVGEDKAQRDPNNPKTLNSFMFCMNNPLLYIDADGNLSEKGAEAFSGQMGTAYNGIPYDTTYLIDYTDLTKRPAHLDCISAIGRTFMDLNKSGELPSALGAHWATLISKYTLKGEKPVQGFYNLANSPEGKTLGLQIIPLKEVKKGDFVLQQDFEHIEHISATKIENGAKLLLDIAASGRLGTVKERPTWLNPLTTHYIGGLGVKFIRFNDK